MYVKIFQDILDSSIWDEDLATRIVWLTMLIMADEQGVVRASISGIRRRAGVTSHEIQSAISTLTGPDIDSKDQSYAGRRVERIDGGWVVLNYKKYREIRTKKQLQDAERQRRHYAKEREASQTSHDITTTAYDSEAEAEAEAVKKNSIVPYGDLFGQLEQQSTQAKTIGDAINNAVEFVFEYFRVAYAKRGTYLLSDERRSRLKRLIKLGYNGQRRVDGRRSRRHLRRPPGEQPGPTPVEALYAAVSEICFAIDGSKKARNIVEHKEYQTIDTVLRDRAQVEKFRDLVNHKQIHPTVAEYAERL